MSVTPVGVDRRFLRFLLGILSKEDADMRTVKELLKLEGRTMIYCRRMQTYACLIGDARREGFKIPSGTPDSILALHESYLCHVRWAGHAAFYNPKSVAGHINRVDYEKYIHGDEDYMYVDKV